MSWPQVSEASSQADLPAPSADRQAAGRAVRSRLAEGGTTGAVPAEGQRSGELRLGCRVWKGK